MNAHAMNAMNVIAEGGLARLKELTRALAAQGIDARVLGPKDGCVSG